MTHYLKWDEQIISDFSDTSINQLYNAGYLFGRIEKGEMYQTRSLRIDLSTFKLSSENRRILKKTEMIELAIKPLPYTSYHWSIGKLAKDFYENKFGAGTFSANKIKELLTEPGKSNFNKLLVYSIDETTPDSQTVILKKAPAAVKDPLIIQEELDPRGSLVPRDDMIYNEAAVGYCIALETNELLHYCYPFYILNSKFQIPNLGLGMMLKAILYAKEQSKQYIYLGSASRPTDTYKLQFEGLEWFDGKKWCNDLEELKKILTQQNILNC